MPKLFIVTGISGSGKTTVAQTLTQYGEVALDSKLNPGLFHFEDAAGRQPLSNHPNDPEWKQRHKWVFNRTKLTELIQHHALAERVFLCGGGDSLKALWPEAAAIFLLQIDASTLHDRLNSPTRQNDFAKNAVTQQGLLDRLENYQKNMRLAGAIVIDATRPIGEVVQAIMEAAR